MKPTRLTQPYRQGARKPGAALTAMLKGSTANGYNPADIHRASYMTGKPQGPRMPRQPRKPRPTR